MSARPLAGVRVLDLGVLIPPSLASRRLSALGADVVSVEPPGGDRIRAVPPLGPDSRSPLHMTQNWGKRSICLDLTVSRDLDRLRALAGAADVILENQLPGRWAAAGLDLEELRRDRPEVVVCSLTGFGQTGPFAVLPSHRLNSDALADTIPVEWHGDQPPGLAVHKLGHRARRRPRGVRDRRGAARGADDRRGRTARRLVLGCAGRRPPQRDRAQLPRCRRAELARARVGPPLQHVPVERTATPCCWARSSRGSGAASASAWGAPI